MEQIQVIEIDQNICTGCQECVKVCPAYAIEGEHGKPQKIVQERCIKCGQCVQKCQAYVSIVDHGAKAYEKVRKERKIPKSVSEPLFAAYDVPHVQEVIQALKNKELFTCVQCAPAVMVALAEEFGEDYGTLTAGKLAAALRALGFNRVYDANFGADVTIMEEVTELIKRKMEGGVLPMFTSCCPAWVKYCENNYPELTNHLSSCKSPQQIEGALIKTYGAEKEKIDAKKIYSVSVMPCTCKTFEAARPEMNASGERDVDVVITTRELAWLIKDAGINWAELKEEKFDEALGNYTGAGAIFGVTGGVMEAAIRSGYEMVTKKPIESIDVVQVRGTEGVRGTNFYINDDLLLKVMVVTGLTEINNILEQVKAGELDVHFIEVMTCPEGCVSGGGQPKLLLNKDRPEAYKKRREAIFAHDKELPQRKSHENPAVKKLYEDFLGEPNSHKAHELLHTTYKGAK